MADGKHRHGDCSCCQKLNTLSSIRDKIYINWKDPNQFSRGSNHCLPPTFPPSHRESWNFGGNGTDLLYCASGRPSSLAWSLVSHKSASLGTPKPCLAHNYYNAENRSSCFELESPQSQQKDIYFVNSLFDEEASDRAPERCNPDTALFKLSSDGSHTMLPDLRTLRGAQGLCQSLHIPGDFRSCPPPCRSLNDTENVYEVVESPKPNRPQRRSVHSQYISLERAQSMETSPRIPPRQKLHPECRDSLRLNLTQHSPEVQKKGYDRKICLPDHLTTDDVKTQRDKQLQEVIAMRTHHGSRFQRKKDKLNSLCKGCGESLPQDQKCAMGNAFNLEHHADTMHSNLQSMEWDYYDVRRLQRRPELQLPSPHRFQSYLDDRERESILTSFSSTDAIAHSTTSTETPVWFEQLMTTTFPSTDSTLYRRSLSLSSLPYDSYQSTKQYDTGSLHLQNSIQRDRKVFTKDKPYTRMKSQLKRDGHIIITGYPGIGKTAKAYQILRDFAAEGILPIVIDTPRDFPERIPGGNAILLIDDIFGSTRFEEENIENWKKVLKKLDDIWNERLKKKGPSGTLSFFFISTTRSYVLKEALPFLGKYNGTIFSNEYVVDLGVQVLSTAEKMNMMNSHAKDRGNCLDFETKEKIVHCHTLAFPQLCQLYFASLQDPKTAFAFFQHPMKFLVATLEPLFISEKRKFACLILLVLFNGNFNTAQLINNTNVEDDVKTKVNLALKYGEVKDPLPSLTEIGQDLKFLIGSFITMDGDRASFMHPAISDAVVFIAGERNTEFILNHSSMKFIYDRVRINPQLSNGALTRPSEGDHTRFLHYLAPAHFKSLTKRFCKEIAAGRFALVCAHEACSLPEFVDLLYHYMKEKGLVARPASNLSARLHHRSGIHSSEKEHGGKFLYWTAWNKNHELCKLFLHKCFFTKKEKSQALIGCSLSGNVQVMALLLKDLHADGVTYEPGSTMPYLERPSYEIKENYIQQIVVLGSTPLHIAAERGQLGIVKLLLTKEAKVNKSGPRVAATSLHYACQGGHTDVVAHLLQSGANVNSLDWVSRTPLHWAASKGHSETVKFLTFNRCFLDAPDAEGLTPLHCAAWGGHLESCVNLLNAGASPKARTRYNKTPLDISIDESFKKKFHDTIVFDFDVYVDDTGVAAWLVGLRGPLILSVSASSMMVKRPRNHEVLFEWSLRTLRRFGHSYTSFKFEAGRNCETGEGVYNFVCSDAEDLMECVKMRLTFLEENGDMLFHRRAPPLH